MLLWFIDNPINKEYHWIKLLSFKKDRFCLVSFLTHFLHVFKFVREWNDLSDQVFKGFVSYVPSCASLSRYLSLVTLIRQFLRQLRFLVFVYVPLYSIYFPLWITISSRSVCPPWTRTDSSFNSILIVILK